MAERLQGVAPYLANQTNPMFTAPIVRQFIEAGKPLFLTAESPGAMTVVREVQAHAKAALFELPQDWDKLELAFDLAATGARSGFNSKRCIILLPEGLKAAQICSIERLVQWSLDHDTQFILVGSPAAWDEWFRHAAFYKQDRLAEFAGAAWDVLTV